MSNIAEHEDVCPHHLESCLSSTCSFVAPLSFSDLISAHNAVCPCVEADSVTPRASIDSRIDALHGRIERSTKQYEDLIAADKKFLTTDMNKEWNQTKELFNLHADGEVFKLKTQIPAFCAAHAGVSASLIPSDFSPLQVIDVNDEVQLSAALECGKRTAVAILVSCSIKVQSSIELPEGCALFARHSFPTITSCGLTVNRGCVVEGLTVQSLDQRRDEAVVMLLGGRLRNCVVTANSSDHYGLLVASKAEDIEVENCTVAAQASYALIVRAPVYVRAYRVLLQNSSRGVRVESGGMVRIVQSEIRNNVVGVESITANGGYVRLVRCFVHTNTQTGAFAFDGGFVQCALSYIKGHQLQGVECCKGSRTEIRRCFLEENDVGIYALENSKAVVENSLLQVNRSSGVMQRASSVLIKSCRIVMNNIGIHSVESGDCAVVSNCIVNNTQTGYFSTGNCSVKAVLNFISDHRVFAIECLGSSQILVAKNVLARNNYGLKIDTAMSQSRVFFNTISDCEVTGIFVRDSFNIVVDGNYVAQCNLIGIELNSIGWDQTNRNSLRFNVVQNCKTSILVIGVNGPTIEGNVTSQNSSFGFAICGACCPADLRFNEFSERSGAVSFLVEVPVSAEVQVTTFRNRIEGLVRVATDVEARLEKYEDRLNVRTMMLAAEGQISALPIDEELLGAAPSGENFVCRGCSEEIARNDKDEIRRHSRECWRLQFQQLASFGADHRERKLLHRAIERVAKEAAVLEGMVAKYSPLSVKGVEGLEAETCFDLTDEEADAWQDSPCA